MGLSERGALEQFELAPLVTRRDIAMLGLVHRTQLGLGPPHFKRFCPPAPRTYRGRGRTRVLDNGRVQDARLPSFSEQTRRSGLGLAPVYNLLPFEAVNLPTVHVFQGAYMHY